MAFRSVYRVPFLKVSFSTVLVSDSRTVSKSSTASSTSSTSSTNLSAALEKSMASTLRTLPSASYLTSNHSP